MLVVLVVIIVIVITIFRTFFCTFRYLGTQHDARRPARVVRFRRIYEALATSHGSQFVGIVTFFDVPMFARIGVQAQRALDRDGLRVEEHVRIGFTVGSNSYTRTGI
jgi:hypothetical protein